MDASATPGTPSGTTPCCPCIRAPRGYTVTSAFREKQPVNGRLTLPVLLRDLARRGRPPSLEEVFTVRWLP